MCVWWVKPLLFYLYTSNFWIKLLYKCIRFFFSVLFNIEAEADLFSVVENRKGLLWDRTRVYKMYTCAARSRFLSSLPKAPPVAALASGARRIQQSRSCHVIDERAVFWKCVFRKALHLYLCYSPPNMADMKKVYVFSIVALFSELEKFSETCTQLWIAAALIVEADVWIWLQCCLVIAVLVHLHLGKSCKLNFETL